MPYPNIEFDFLECNSFKMKPNGRNCCDWMSYFQLVQYCCDDRKDFISHISNEI